MDPMILKQLRKSRHLTQKELAELLHVSPSAVSQYERSVIKPHRETLFEIAKLFSVSVDFLNGTSPYQSIEAQMNEPYADGAVVCDVIKMLLSVDSSHRNTVLEVLNGLLSLQAAQTKQNGK